MLHDLLFLFLLLLDILTLRFLIDDLSLILLLSYLVLALVRLHLNVFLVSQVSFLELALHSSFHSLLFRSNNAEGSE